MIITKLIGGNGNQMFQYAAGFILAKRFNTQLLLDTKYLEDKSGRYFRFAHRDYALGMFKISGRIATENEIKRFTVPRVGNKYIYHIKKRITKDYNVYKEYQIRNIHGLLNLPDDAYIEGYWQNAEYVNYLGSSIRNEFIFKNELSEQCLNVLQKIHSTNSIAVIFRRGDYLNHPNLDIVRLNFYYRSLKLISDNIAEPVLFVFSDDIAWCKQKFKPLGFQYNFVDQQLTGPVAEYYLHLITNCKHFIIPNSTFAWWGAWLSNNPEKIVIAPAKWHKNQVEERNSILPNEWFTF